MEVHLRKLYLPEALLLLISSSPCWGPKYQFVAKSCRNHDYLQIQFCARLLNLKPWTFHNRSPHSFLEGRRMCCSAKGHFISTGRKKINIYTVIVCALSNLEKKNGSKFPRTLPFLLTLPFSCKRTSKESLVLLWELQVPMFVYLNL